MEGIDSKEQITDGLTKVGRKEFLSGIYISNKRGKTEGDKINGGMMEWCFCRRIRERKRAKRREKDKDEEE